MKLHPSGYYLRENGDFFFPVGANYWPASCGVEMWRVWPEAEIAADLDLLVSLELNAVRFFARLQDFEPSPGVYADECFVRMGRFLELCAERKIMAQPSFFVGWMSGGLFWPEWKGARNLFSDEGVVERSVAYARVLARALRPHQATLFGIDLGNELDALAESRSAPPAAVREWCRRVTAAIREELPEVLIHSGCDKGQVTQDAGWRLAPGWQPGVDVLTMHGYPVPGWHPVPSGGLRDPLTQSLLPFYVKCARAGGPVLLQEFGTIVPGTSPHCESYLRAVLPACLAAGANGFLWWCLRDIEAHDAHPYAKNDFESRLGLVDASGAVKPGLRYYLEFARQVTSMKSPPTVARGRTVLYWPKHYYERDEPENPGNVVRESAARLCLAHHLLGTGSTGVVRGGERVPAEVTTIVLAGACLVPEEIAALHRWVTDGGRLLWHGPNAYNWGPAACALIGAEVADYHAARSVSVSLAGRAYSLNAACRGIRLEVTATAAEVLARDEEGLPVVLRHRLGRGVVLSALADVEGGFLSRWAADGGSASVRDEAREWFSGMRTLLS